MKPDKIATLLLGLPGLTFAEVCTNIEDDEARLACYDARNQESAPAPAEPVQPEAPPETMKEDLAPATEAEAAAVVEADSPDEFGVRETSDGPKEYVEGTIVEILKSGQIEYVRLDNGQVWLEQSRSRSPNLKSGDSVRIKAGSDGAVSFELTTQREDGLGRPVKGETISLLATGAQKPEVFLFARVEVLERDFETDAATLSIQEVIEHAGSHPEGTAQDVDLILIAKNLERVADHATNIAEEVILAAESLNVKHEEKLAH